MYDFESKIKQGGEQRLINCVENILLRPNDNKAFMGEEKYNLFKQAVENILNEQHKDTKIYTYYYTLPTVNHGFCSFERWERGLLY